MPSSAIPGIAIPGIAIPGLDGAGVGWNNVGVFPNANQYPTNALIGNVWYVSNGDNTTGQNVGMNVNTFVFTSYASDPNGYRSNAQSGVVNGLFMVQSGYTGGTQNLGYNPTTNAWTTFAVTPYSGGFGGSTGAASSSLYSTGISSGLTTTYVWSATTNAWSTLATNPISRGRMPSGNAQVGNVMYGIGGDPATTHATSSTTVATNEGYNVATNAYTTYASDLVSRSQGGLVVLGTSVCVCQGANTALVGTFTSYDSIGNTWTSLLANPDALYGSVLTVVPGISFHHFLAAAGGSTTVNQIVVNAISTCAISFTSTANLSGLVDVYKQSVLNDSPSALWMLNETSGTVALDATGNGHVGTYSGPYKQGQYSLIPNDIVDGSMYVSGNGAGVTGTTAPQTITTAWSLEAWITTGTLPTSGWDAYLSVGNSGGYAIGVGNGGNGGSELVVLFQTIAFYNSGYTLSSNTTYHVVVTYTAHGFVFYVNGVQVTTAATSNDPNAVDATFLIGNQGSGRSFTGSIQAAAVYPVVLTAGQVTNHYNASQLASGVLQSAGPASLVSFSSTATLSGLAPSYEKVVQGDSPSAFWMLNERSGTQAADLSGNGHTGTYGGTYTQNQPSLLTGDPGDGSLLLSTTAASGVSGTVSPQSSTTTWSLEAWIKTPAVFNTAICAGLVCNGNSATGYQMLLSDATGGDGNGGGYLKLLFQGVVFEAGVYLLSVSTIYHVVCSYSSGTANWHVNGVLVATQTGLTAGNAPTGGFGVGFDNGATTRQFSGEMQAAAIYPTALSQSQVSNHYVAGNSQQLLTTIPSRSIAFSADGAVLSVHTVDAVVGSSSIAVVSTGSLSGIVLELASALTPPTFVSAGTNVGVNATSVPVPTPPSIVAGNLLFAFVTCATQNATVVAPAGWTEVATETNTGVTSWIYYKFATSSEPASYTWVFSYGYGAGVIAQYSSVAGVPVDASTVDQNYGGTAYIAALTSTAPNDTIVVSYANKGYNVSFGTNPAMTLRSQAGAVYAGPWLYDGLLSTPGVSGTYDVGTSTNYWAGIAVGLLAGPYIAFSAIGNLSIAIALSSTAVVAVTASGSLYVSDAIVGSASVGVTAVGVLGVSEPIIGSATITVVSNGNLYVSEPIVGSASVFVVANASLDVGDLLTGSALIVTSANGSLYVSDAIVGSVSLTVSANGNLGLGGAITGSTSIVVSTNGVLYVSEPLTGSTVVSVVPVAILFVSEPLVGSAVVVASSSGILHVSELLTGSTVVTVASIGNLFVNDLLTGSVLLAVSVTGDVVLGEVFLTSMLVINFGLTSALSGVDIPITGTAVITVTPTGDTSIAMSVNGQSVSTFVGVALLRFAIHLVGAELIVVTPSGVLFTQSYALTGLDALHVGGVGAVLSGVGALSTRGEVPDVGLIPIA